MIWGRAGGGGKAESGRAEAEVRREGSFIIGWSGEDLEEKGKNQQVSNEEVVKASFRHLNFPKVNKQIHMKSRWSASAEEL